MSVASLFDQPLTALPGAVSESIQMMVSLKRIEKFLLVEEIDTSKVVEGHSNEVAIKIKKGNYYWKR
jgi:hypothetical protein